MDILEYKGNIYRRYSAKWCDDRNLIVHEMLQKELNNEYAKTLDISEWDVRSLITEGDKYKASATYILAIRFYEEACKKCGRTDITYILPRISSCYRKAHQPSKAIALFSFAKQKFGANIMTEPLLTTVAAAYCDLGEYEKAKKCCNIAYTNNAGMVSNELRMVYKRIEKETRGIKE